MPVTPTDVDNAVPSAGTPVRSLTNTLLKGLITDIAAVGVGVGVGTVNTFADLPAAASHTNERWWVLTSTGVWLVNRRTKGAYYSDGAVWSYLGDFPVTAVEIGNTPAGGIAAVNVQAAINELDTEKAPKGAIGLSGLTQATARLLGRSTAGTGAVEEITLGTNLSFTGTTLNAAGGSGADPLALANAPTTPSAGSISIGEQTLADENFLTTISSTGWAQTYQQMLGRGKLMGYFAGANQTAFDRVPGSPPNLTVVGTPAGNSLTFTNFFVRQTRINWPSAAAAGSLASAYAGAVSGRIVTVGGVSGGGFLYVAQFGMGDTVAGARMFIGLSTSITAPTNVEPSTLTNVIGVAQLSSSNNLHIVFGGGTAQAPIDLGVNFPANTSGVDWYELMIYSSPGSSASVGYRVTRKNTGDVASGTLTNTTPGTTLPANTTGLCFHNWRCNNATASAVTLILGSLAVHLNNN